MVLAEALGAIGDEECLLTVLSHKNDEMLDVRETCGLAISKIIAANNNKSNSNPGSKHSKFYSIDPADPLEETSVETLKNILLKEDFSLSHRYKAMFALRDLRTSESIQALCEGKCHIYVNKLIVFIGELKSKII